MLGILGDPSRNGGPTIMQFLSILSFGNFPRSVLRFNHPSIMFRPVLLTLPCVYVAEYFTTALPYDR